MRAQPFGVNPDPAFLYMSANHREAFASMVYSLESGLGFAGLVGEPGTGKTTLLFTLLARYAASANTAFVLPTTRSTDDLMRSVMSDLHLDVFTTDEVALHDGFRKFLIDSAHHGKRVIVIVDEAQSFSDDALESLRLLSNFETPRLKLLHIILAGQPQLLERLDSRNLTQLRQRITVIGHLSRLDAADTEAYIRHRISTAGYQGPDLFTPEALALITSKSKGTPRLINALCFNALSLACALQRKIVDREIMDEVLDDCSLTQSSPFADQATDGRLEREQLHAPSFAAFGSPSPAPVQRLLSAPAVDAIASPHWGLSFTVAATSRLPFRSFSCNTQSFFNPLVPSATQPEGPAELNAALAEQPGPVAPVAIIAPGASDEPRQYPRSDPEIPLGEIPGRRPFVRRKLNWTARFAAGVIFVLLLALAPVHKQSLLRQVGEVDLSTAPSLRCGACHLRQTRSSKRILSHSQLPETRLASLHLPDSQLRLRARRLSGSSGSIELLPSHAPVIASYLPSPRLKSGFMHASNRSASSRLVKLADRP